MENWARNIERRSSDSQMKGLPQTSRPVCRFDFYRTLLLSKT
jgi:hypothetical protein